ncbi:hypothetical protein IHE45_10G089900 [Dioscorea alata]|uniref:Uncharacterized protein n=1 Tax=Dioscorea alata TaxID=55571 RepID=A0ACB7VCQ1_DIOAL|nr:hypothetical protein IHE45_10G089900 [Dioscorea alata]
MNPSNIVLFDGLQKAIHAESSASTSTTTTTTTTTSGSVIADVKEDGKKECLVMVTEESGQRKGEDEEDCGRERLKRHRVEMAGRVWIPEIWGQENFLKDWIDCASFDTCLVPKGLVLAREALVQECRQTNSGGLQIENRC